MIYDVAAIPTRYNSVQFRSRLEARWAAFFDLAEIKWDYEPFDLDGWTPDFLIKGKVPALIEVKPLYFSEFESLSIDQAKTAAGKAFRSASQRRENPQFETIVLGAGPFRSEGTWALGVMALERQLGSADLAELHQGYGPNTLDYSARFGSFQYRVGGQHNGDHHIRRIRDNRPIDLWREAGNKVQWHPHRLREVAA
ncbi:hypothetical protein N7379_23155 [Rhizobium pusense]|uniref:hypothetical protein n=1 Tax=Agrobacterium pusense TaxID=648995 RepID=UPI002446D247|nr:hypothetical protein [Agrobacterium pusense]MDH0117390.1 hypothetical protein [Agrobacterium pusense]